MARIDERSRERIAELFERHLAVGLHHGSQLAVYVDGELEIDLAGGESDPEGEPETRGTRHLLFSCTKPYAGAALHSLVDDGELGYDDRVVDHWPTFAEEGSEKAEVTVRQVLSHTAGLPWGEIDSRPDLWTDWEACVEAIEEMDLVFPPGERPSYHALTYGWLVGELVRRVSASPIREAAAERIFDPLGMDDTGIGLAEDEPDDVATLVAFEEFDRCRNPGEGLGGKNSHLEVAEPFNSEAIHRAVIPAANGIGTARDMARFYGCLAKGGELDGTRVLSESTVDELSTLQAEADEDGTLGRASRYGLGVWKGGTATSPFGSVPPERVFGHSGLGSSVGWADPELGVGFSYVTNGVREGSYEHLTRLGVMSDAVRLVLDR